MTKRELFVAIVKGEMTEEMQVKAQECLEAMDVAAEKAKSRERKPSAKELEAQKANEALAEQVLAQLGDEPKTAGDIFALGIEGINTVQKASSLLRSLVKAEKAVAGDVKREKGVQKGYTLA